MRTLIGFTRSPCSTQRRPVSLVAGAGWPSGAARPCDGSRPAKRERVFLARLGYDILHVRLPAEGGVGHQQHALPRLDLELKARRQVRQETAAGVIDRDDDRISDDVLRHARVQADLRDLALERIAWQGADGEMDVLAHVDRADVGLVDRRPDLQAAQVLGDQEEARGIQAGDDDLADVDPPVEDDPLDRRADRRVPEVDGGLFEVGPGDGQRALIDGQRCLGRLEVRQGRRRIPGRR